MSAKTKTVEAFMRQCNGAPIDLCEAAEEAKKVLDDTQLAKAAKGYLVAKSVFENALEEIGFEFG